MSTVLADDLLLLLLDPAGRPLTDGTRLPRALAGAVLLDLLRAGAIRLAEPGDRVAPGRLVVLRDRVGDPLLDDAAAALGAGAPRTPGAAIEKLQKGLRPRVTERLERAGLVRVERARLLGLVPRTSRVPAGARAELHAALVRVLTDRAAPASDPRAVASIALLSAIGATARVFPDLDRRAVQRRAAEIGAGDWASGAVRQAVRAIDAALVAAVTVSAAGVAAAS
ncbi:GPP34 family phosphoprotein [Nocardia thailandica]|uniref:GPP34 family phosphoprotein n=1 Tax=Nocardia thailandica TaxID=257275 RepID=A0ABW6PR80_9NOCA